MASREGLWLVDLSILEQWGGHTRKGQRRKLTDKQKHRAGKTQTKPLPLAGPSILCSSICKRNKPFAQMPSQTASFSFFQRGDPCWRCATREGSEGRPFKLGISTSSCYRMLIKLARPKKSETPARIYVEQLCSRPKRRPTVNDGTKNAASHSPPTAPLTSLTFPKKITQDF